MFNYFSKKYDIVLLTNFRSVFGTICIEKLHLNHLDFFTYILTNNPYTIKDDLPQDKHIVPCDIKSNMSMLFHDRTIDIAQSTKSEYQEIKSIDSKLFLKIIEKKPKAIVLGDAPIIDAESIALANKYNIPIINLHAAELPMYRGNYSTYAMVKENQKLCMTYHLVEKEIDAGKILGKFFIEKELTRFDTYFTAERKLYIYGIEKFFNNFDIYLQNTHADTSSEQVMYPVVSVSQEDRDTIKRNFKLYLEKAYHIKQEKISIQTSMLQNLAFNSKLSNEILNTKIEQSSDIGKLTQQIYLDFEDDLLESDKKFGLFHVDSSPIYKKNTLLDTLPNNIKYPNDKTWSIILSHDVDMIPESVDVIKKAFLLEKKYNVTSTYLLASLESLEKRHEHDPTYILDSAMCRELIYMIAANNHEIGIHGSFDSYTNCSLLQKEKQRLEAFIGMEVKSIRQHFLNFRKEETPYLQNMAGFVIDSSLGFPTDVGIRNGYDSPFHFYDCREKNNIDILTVPYLIMDQNILWNELLENSSHEEKLQYLITLINKAKHNGTTVILDWHLHTIELEGWWEIYDDILNYISHDDTCAVMNMEQFYYAYTLLNETKA